jgi:hypothetical protein
VHFWQFTREEKLEYLDLFVKAEEEDEEVPELTACDYLSYHEQDYLMFGTSKGELGIISLANRIVIWRRKICSAEILTLRCYVNYTVLGAHDGNLYIWNHNSTILQAEPSPSFNKMNLYYSPNALFLDADGHEGVVATSEGLYYVNLPENFHSLLIGAPSAPVLMSKVVGNHLLTSHTNGRLKLWNLDTAEELKTYKWKYPCTEAYFDEGVNKLVCFCSNQSVKLVNLKKFTKEENYLPEDVKIDARTDDYVIYSAMVAFGGRPARWTFYAKGNVFSFALSQEGKKKALKGDKVLELGYVITEVIVNPEKNLIIAAADNGTVFSYNVDFASQADNVPLVLFSPSHC